MIYPSIIDQIESEYNGNELIVKIINHDLTHEIHLYFDITDDVYMLVDEIQVPKQ
jgi:predicted Zn-dependent protease with MMP-like domain